MFAPHAWGGALQKRATPAHGTSDFEGLDFVASLKRAKLLGRHGPFGEGAAPANGFRFHKVVVLRPRSNVNVVARRPVGRVARPKINTDSAHSLQSD